MTERSAPRLSKLPFLLADAALIGVAFWIVVQQPRPLAPWPLGLMILCVALAMGFLLLPFLLEYNSQVKLAESVNLTSAVAEINRLREVADQIRLATGQWQGVQEHSSKAVAAARDIGERMTTEAKDFSAFMQKANDAEKGHLRLEVEKLRRAEGDWLQVSVRVLDHVFALTQAAQRSGQRNVAEQLARFQNACRDAVRRVGLVPFEATPDEPFDAAKHQLAEPDAAPPAGARAGEMLACGYSYQGQLLRRAMVTLNDGRPAGPKSVEPASGAAEQASVAQKELVLHGAAEAETGIPPAGGA